MSNKGSFKFKTKDELRQINATQSSNSEKVVSTFLQTSKTNAQPSNLSVLKSTANIQTSSSSISRGLQNVQKVDQKKGSGKKNSTMTQYFGSRTSNIDSAFDEAPINVVFDTSGSNDLSFTSPPQKKKKKQSHSATAVSNQSPITLDDDSLDFNSIQIPVFVEDNTEETVKSNPKQASKPISPLKATNTASAVTIPTFPDQKSVTFGHQREVCQIPPRRQSSLTGIPPASKSTFLRLKANLMLYDGYISTMEDVINDADISCDFLHELKAKLIPITDLVSMLKSVVNDQGSQRDDVFTEEDKRCSKSPKIASTSTVSSSSVFAVPNDQLPVHNESKVVNGDDETIQISGFESPILYDGAYDECAINYDDTEPIPNGDDDFDAQIPNFDEDLEEGGCPPPDTVADDVLLKAYTELSPLASTQVSRLSPNKAATVKIDDSNHEFYGFHFKHSVALKEKFADVFGLKHFRYHQLPAINCALLGNDCFILMPTGGGKSLCYQLPAIISAGVTVVISPLRSLITDQVRKLQSIGIAAAYLSGDLAPSEVSSTYHRLMIETVQGTTGIQLLYVTPEMVAASPRLMNSLKTLHERNRLARFVIDEAHCVSQWGHDFRPDYKRLKELREHCPGVPIMALTATANARAKFDIISQLKLSLKPPQIFTQSFNRPNLRWSVEPKKGGEKVINTMIQKIKKCFSGKSGIIYCLSRKDCENVADKLMMAEISAAAYHAGLVDDLRLNTQLQWLSGEIHVVCATIAFGMGIDKADVRYVFHHSLPKSMEGYYQETGRAGRDGLPSECILYYSSGDVMRYKQLIFKEESLAKNGLQRQHHLDNLTKVQLYCEDVVDCRRCVILEYFGETFDQAECQRRPNVGCDICGQKTQYKPKDLTELVCQIVDVVGRHQSGSSSMTVCKLLDLLKGQKGKALALSNDKYFGSANHLARSDVERLLRKMLMERILDEKLVETAHYSVVAYLRCGANSNQYRNLSNVKTRIWLPCAEDKKSSTNAASSGSSANSFVTDANEERRRLLLERLVQECRDMATRICRELGVPALHSLFSPDAFTDMAEFLPTTKEDMVKSVSGFTKDQYNRLHGEQFIEIIRACRDELDLLPPPPVAQRSSMTATRAANFVPAKSIPTNSTYFQRGRGRGRGARSRGRGSRGAAGSSARGRGAPVSSGGWSNPKPSSSNASKFSLRS